MDQAQNNDAITLRDIPIGQNATVVKLTGEGALKRTFTRETS